MQRLAIRKYLAFVLILSLVLPSFLTSFAPQANAASDVLTVEEALAESRGTAVTMKGIIIAGTNGEYAIKVADRVDSESTIVVQLTKDYRAEFSPQNNPAALNKEIIVSGKRDVYSGSESIENVTSLKFTEPNSGEHSPQPAEGTIADARTKLGQTVTVEGIVTADN